MSESAIIVGGGHAAAELATSIREQGWSGPIELYSRDLHLPYHRPPLSKAFMSGAVTASNLLIKQPEAYQKAAATVHLGTDVTHIEAAKRVIHLAGGEQRSYRVLALATGARARTLAVEGSAEAVHADNYHVLRSLRDAEQIRSQCVAGQRLLVIGAGYIGLELAASGIGLGMHVTVIETQPRVLARVAGVELADFMAARHRAAGVDLRLGAGVDAIRIDTTSRRVTGIRCSDGSEVGADLIVVGIGVVPNSELAEAAGLAIDNGIAVDRDGWTSDPHIVAAGDCSSHPSALYGRRIRLESVPNALEQARTAAASVNGKSRPYDQVPWFWSDQYDLRMKSVGLLQGYDRCIVRGDPATRSFSAFYLQGERILAVDTVNRAPEFLLAKRIVAERVQIPDALIADEGYLLKQALPAS